MSKSLKNTTTKNPHQKFLEDKKLVLKYLRGEITLKALNERGVRVTMPL